MSPPPQDDARSAHALSGATPTPLVPSPFLHVEEGRVVNPLTDAVLSADDALFAAFLDGYARDRDARAALKRAVVFASWKLGAASAAEGFLGAEPLRQLVATEPPPYEP